METHGQIIRRLGIREVARALGHSNHTTVQGWRDRDNIPVEHWADVVHAAEQIGKPLTVRELMPPELRDAAA
jgi:hypothetical protein